MKWKKHGVVWMPDSSVAWAQSHATCPTPLLLDDGILRIYVQCRDKNNVGRVGYVDVESNDPRKVVAVSEHPVLDIGEPGCFDDNGVLQTCVLRENDGRVVMYYVGFELSLHIRYRLFTGIAVSVDGGKSFNRIAKVPVLDRTHDEPFFRGGPFVVKDYDGYIMWYVSGGSWIEINGKSMPVYQLKRISSADGITWDGESEVALPLSEPNEHGFGRPYVVKSGQRYKMFYSIRKKMPCAYRLGYAESVDGHNWTRMDDKIGLDVSDFGWDSESIEYTAPITINGKTWIFYNGNDFGGTGFGVAELLES